MEEKQGLVLGGDGRGDSHSYNAKYDSYSVTDLSKNEVAHLKFVQVTAIITPMQ